MTLEAYVLARYREAFEALLWHAVRGASIVGLSVALVCVAWAVRARRRARGGSGDGV